LKEKIALTQLQQSACYSQRDLNEMFGIGKTEGQAILKRKIEFQI